MTPENYLRRYVEPLQASAETVSAIGNHWRRTITIPLMQSVAPVWKR